MNQGESLLTYIWHDCFVYRSADCVIVFDYWCNPHRPYNLSGQHFDEYLMETARVHDDEYLPVYFIVSHHHKDHFNKNIFEWSRRLPRVHYIISKDVERAVKYMLKPDSTYKGPNKVEPQLVTTIRPGEQYTDELIRVHAFGSTDIGNSYVVEADGLRIFHAGDLNAWIWRDESTESENRQALCDYLSKLEDIAQQFESLDVAMFPVDAREGLDAWEGAFRLVHRIDVSQFIPMHFCLYETDKQQIEYIRKATDFARYANPEHGCYCAMTQPFESMIISHRSERY